MKHPQPLPIWTGGMFRCCLNTIDTLRAVEAEGYRVPCYICAAPLQVRNGAWELARAVSDEGLTDNARIVEVPDAA